MQLDPSAESDNLNDTFKVLKNFKTNFLFFFFFFRIYYNGFAHIKKIRHQIAFYHLNNLFYRSIF